MRLIRNFIKRWVSDDPWVRSVLDPWLYHYMMRGSQEDIDNHPAMERELIFNKTKGHFQIFKNGAWIDLPELDGYCIKAIRRSSDGRPHQVLMEDSE